MQAMALRVPLTSSPKTNSLVWFGRFSAPHLVWNIMGIRKNGNVPCPFLKKNQVVICPFLRRKKIYIRKPAKSNDKFMKYTCKIITMPGEDLILWPTAV